MTNIETDVRVYTVIVYHYPAKGVTLDEAVPKAAFTDPKIVFNHASVAKTVVDYDERRCK